MTLQARNIHVKLKNMKNKAGKQNVNCSPSKGQRKNIKFFRPAAKNGVAGRFLCSKAQLVFFYRRQYTPVTLDSSGIVTDVALNHLHEFLFAGETLAVIAFPFQNAPESFHRSIVNAISSCLSNSIISASALTGINTFFNFSIIGIPSSSNWIITHSL